MDLISRKAAIKHLYGRLIESANNNVGVREDAGIVFEDIATERLKTWIYEIPTAEKVGKWIKNESRYGWHCSACEEDDLYAFAWNSYTGENELQDHYCPHCGARMRKDGEEE